MQTQTGLVQIFCLLATDRSLSALQSGLYQLQIQIQIFWAQVAVSHIRPQPLNFKWRPHSLLNFNEQIHLANWTNTFCNVDKYNWQIQTNTNVLWAQVAESHIRPQPLNLSRELKGTHALCNRFQLCLMIIIF